MEVRYTDPKELKPHPLNESLIPPMTPEEFEALVEDVKEKGVLQPLEVQKGTKLILDGRNRWKAALQAEMNKIPFREVEVTDEEVALYVLERVPTHRSLSKAQKAALAAEYAEHLQKDQKTLEKRLKNLLPFKKTATADSENIHIRSSKNRTSDERGRIIQIVAKKFGVNHQYVQIAWNLKRLVPESFQLLKTGELSIQDAQGILSRARIEREIAFSYPVLLKRTHHEEANHHSQTHDSRRTQGLPQEARALAGRSGKDIGDRTKCGQSLGNWQTENPPLPIRTSGLLRKGKQDLNAPYLPSLDNYIVISLYQTLQCNGGLKWKSNTPSPQN